MIATGSRWRRDGFGRSNGFPIAGFDRANVYTPDDVLRGVIPDGPVLLFDDGQLRIGALHAR